MIDEGDLKLVADRKPGRPRKDQARKAAKKKEGKKTASK